MLRLDICVPFTIGLTLPSGSYINAPTATVPKQINGVTPEIIALSKQSQATGHMIAISVHPLSDTWQDWQHNPSLGLLTCHDLWISVWAANSCCSETAWALRWPPWAQHLQLPSPPMHIRPAFCTFPSYIFICLQGPFISLHEPRCWSQKEGSSDGSLHPNGRKPVSAFFVRLQSLATDTYARPPDHTGPELLFHP